MIHRKHRFHGLRSLGFVLRRGQTIRAPGISLKFILNSRRQFHRASVSVSRKVSKSAVVRNRIRRRVYERLRLAEPSITGSYDLMFVAHDAMLAELPAAGIDTRVTRLLEKAGVVSSSRPPAIPNHAIVVPKEKKHSNVHHTDRPADL
ncbi:MAG: ribonuclease P protein component [Candidatus Saccharimonadales bacterium]